MSQPVTVLMADPAAEELEVIARQENRPVGEVGGRLIEESLRQFHSPNIEFRTFDRERHACIKGGLQVWPLVMVAKAYGMDATRVAEHLSLKPEHAEASIQYYNRYPAEIDQALDDNDLGYYGLKAMLPGLQLAIVPIDATATK